MTEPTPKPRRRRLRRLILLGFVLVALLFVTGLIGYRLTMPGAVFLVRMTDTSPEAQYLGKPFVEEVVTIVRGDRSIRARVYKPREPHRRTILFVHGVHNDGIDEARFVPVARKLTGMGFAVVTPEITDLMNYEILARSVDDIEACALWTLDESGLVKNDSDGKIGIMGICFGGGLCISAAGRPTLQNRIAYLFSIGGHGDLHGIMTYLVTGKLPPGGEHLDLTPHIYGVAVVLRQLADKCVPPEQVEPLRECLMVYLQDDKEKAISMKDALPEPARRYAAWCIDRDSKALGPILEPHLALATKDRWLSPVKCPPPTCPVYLLHGAADDLIPPTESLRLAKHLEGRADVLVSDLIGHVEVEGDELGKRVEMAMFMTRILRE